ncbi:chitobiase/beta-hexosaminidase C-terminal domain-containing protein [Exiguobacterium artemiae]
MKNRLSLLAVPIICALTVASIPVSASANSSTLSVANLAAGESKAQVVQEDDWDYGDTWDEEEMLPEVEVSFGSGIETEGEEVELTASPNTKIYYTTDGTVPTISSTIYSKPIVLSGKVDLRYMAVDESGNKSEIGEEVYYTYSIDSTLENEEAMTGSGVPGMKISVMKEDKSIGQTVVDKNGKFKVRFERQKVDTVLTVVAEIDGYMNNRSQIQVWDDTPRY